MARLPSPPTGPREAASQRSRAMVKMIKSTCSQHRGKLCSGMMRIGPVAIAMPSSVAGLELLAQTTIWAFFGLFGPYYLGHLGPPYWGANFVQNAYQHNAKLDKNLLC